MSYIGREPTVGNFIKLDDISSSFDGVTTEFDLTSNTVAVTIPSTRQMHIVVNGVFQEPGVAYQVGSDETKIQFAEAPDSGSTFWGTIFGAVYDIGTVSSGAINTDKLDSGAVSTVKIQDSAITTPKINDDAVTTAKIGAGEVQNTNIADNAVTIQKIQDNAVTFPKVASSAIASQAEAEAGTAANKLMTPQRTEQRIAQLPFTEAFASSEQTITAGGELSLPHGLSSEPTLIQMYIICKTAEGGYSVDDKFIITGAHELTSTATYSLGVTAVPDDTDIVCRYGTFSAIFNIKRKDTGGSFNITPANWRLVVRAWA